MTILVSQTLYLSQAVGPGHYLGLPDQESRLGSKPHWVILEKPEPLKRIRQLEVEELKGRALLVFGH
jgi:hypothetical protein